MNSSVIVKFGAFNKPAIYDRIEIDYMRIHPLVRLFNIESDDRISRFASTRSSIDVTQSL